METEVTILVDFESKIQKAGKKGKNRKKNRKKPVSPPIRRVARYLLPTHSKYAKYVCSTFRKVGNTQTILAKSQSWNKLLPLRTITRLQLHSLSPCSHL